MDMIKNSLFHLTHGSNRTFSPNLHKNQSLLVKANEKEKNLNEEFFKCI